MAKIEGLEELGARLDALPELARQAMADAVAKGAEEFANAAKAAAPVNDMDPHPGALRDSVHVIDGSTALARKVVADAKDLKGDEYGAHVEFGHRTKGGVHVPAQPFFYPAWRLSKKRIRSRIARAITTAAKMVARDG